MGSDHITVLFKKEKHENPAVILVAPEISLNQGGLGRMWEAAETDPERSDLQTGGLCFCVCVCVCIVRCKSPKEILTIVV